MTHQWFLKMPDGKTVGPLSSDKMQHLVSQGLSDSCRVRREDQNTWQPVSEFSARDATPTPTASQGESPVGRSVSSQPAFETQAVPEKRPGAVPRQVPEERAAANRYPALRTISAIFWAMGIGVCILAAIVILFSLFVTMSAIKDEGVLGGILISLPTLVTAMGMFFAALIYFAFAEIIKLLIDVSEDTRVTQLLTKRAVYGS